MLKRALIIMAKRPSPGKTKTRLSPPFSKLEAADLYTCFLHDVIQLARSIPNITPFFASSPTNEAAYFRKLAPDFGLIAQEGNNLGERLDHVLSCCLEEGYNQAIALSSDTPSLPSAYVVEAFAALDDTAVDVTLGPCEDGGYYLIGWKRPHSKLVREVQMSTPTVLKDTLALAKSESLRVQLLPTWYDVDTVTELERLMTHLKSDQYTYQFLEKRSFLLW